MVIAVQVSGPKGRLHPDEVVDPSIPVEQFLLTALAIPSANGEVIAGVVVGDVGCVDGQRANEDGGGA